MMSIFESQSNPGQFALFSSGNNEIPLAIVHFQRLHLCFEIVNYMNMAGQSHDCRQV
jgi:hypothetical protein